MATLRENAQYFRQMIHRGMNQLFTFIAYYRRVFFERAHVVAAYALTKIGEGFTLAYKALRAFFCNCYIIAKWLVCNLPIELVRFSSLLLRKSGEFLYDLFTILKPCVKWLVKYSSLALWRVLGVCIGILLAISDLAVEGVKYVLKHSIGLMLPSLFTTSPATPVLAANSVNYSPTPATPTLQKIANHFTPDFQRTQPCAPLLLFPDKLSEKRASLTP